jgi:outer membrane protein OmpA-like peptidoglycan-associated protein
MHTVTKTLLLAMVVAIGSPAQQKKASFDWDPIVESVLKTGNATLARAQKVKLRELLSTEVSKRASDPVTRSAVAKLTHQIGLLASSQGHQIEAVKWLELSRFLNGSTQVQADLLRIGKLERTTIPTVDDLRSAVFDVPMRRSLVKFKNPNQTPVGTQPPPPATNTTTTTDPTSIHVTFAFNKHDLPETARQKAKVIGDFLAQNPTVQFKLAGHTDEVGDDAYNQTLSEKRSESVATYIADNCNVPRTRLQTVGKGKSAPRWPGAVSGEKAEQNRRVELETM